MNKHVMVVVISVTTTQFLALSRLQTSHPLRPSSRAISSVLPFPTLHPHDRVAHWAHISLGCNCSQQRLKSEGRDQTTLTLEPPCLAQSLAYRRSSVDGCKSLPGLRDRAQVCEHRQGLRIHCLLSFLSLLFLFIVIKVIWVKSQ